MDDSELDERLRALAHGDRRRILRQCAGSATSAGEIAAASSLSPATVSEHLKVLRKAGLLVLDRDGRRWMYRTDMDALGAVLDGAGASLGIAETERAPTRDPAATSRPETEAAPAEHTGAGTHRSA